MRPEPGIPVVHGREEVNNECHEELVWMLAASAAHLADRIEQGPPVYAVTLEGIDADWQRRHPGAASLTGPPSPPRRRGPDGRPAPVAPSPLGDGPRVRP